MSDFSKKKNQNEQYVILCSAYFILVKQKKSFYLSEIILMRKIWRVKFDNKSGIEYNLFN